MYGYLGVNNTTISTFKGAVLIIIVRSLQL